MKEKFKGIIIGSIIGSVIAVTSVCASNGTVQKILSYNNIKISMNGNEIKPTDADGNYVEPFIIDGTTYLPVRAVANAIGLNVGWDESTKTVLLSNTDTTTQTTGNVVYDKGGIKITYNGIKDSGYSKNIQFLIENNSSIGITVQARDESINGFMIEGIMSDDVQPGKKANGELTYYNSTLEENGITSIKNIELSFHIFDKETWDTIDDSDTIIINN